MGVSIIGGISRANLNTSPGGIVLVPASGAVDAAALDGHVGVVAECAEWALVHALHSGIILVQVEGGVALEQALPCRVVSIVALRAPIGQHALAHEIILEVVVGTVRHARNCGGVDKVKGSSRVGAGGNAYTLVRVGVVDAHQHAHPRGCVGDVSH